MRRYQPSSTTEERVSLEHAEAALRVVVGDRLAALARLAPELARARDEDGREERQVRDDLDALLFALPKRIREPLMRHPMRTSLLEVVLDLGRRPEARFLGVQGGEFVCDSEITAEDHELAEEAVGDRARRRDCCC